MNNLTRFDLVHDEIHVYLFDDRTGIPDFHRTTDRLLERVAVLKFLDAVDDEVLLQYLHSRNLSAPAVTPVSDHAPRRRLVRRRG